MFVDWSIYTYIRRTNCLLLMDPALSNQCWLKQSCNIHVSLSFGWHWTRYTGGGYDRYQHVNTRHLSPNSLKLTTVSQSGGKKLIKSQKKQAWYIALIKKLEFLSWGENYFWWCLSIISNHVLAHQHCQISFMFNTSLFEIACHFILMIY